MNIEELKQHAISLCYRQIKEQMGKGMSYTESRGGAVRDVATIVCVDVRANAHQQGEPNLTTQALAEWVNEILSQGIQSPGSNSMTEPDFNSATIKDWRS